MDSRNASHASQSQIQNLKSKISSPEPRTAGGLFPQPAEALKWTLAALTFVCSIAATPSAEQTKATDEQRDWPATIAQLQQQVYQRPGHAQSRKQLAIAHNNYGLELADAGNLAAAVLELREAIEIDPVEPGFKTNLARLLLRTAQQAYAQEHLPDAKRAIEQALAADPREANAYALLGQIEYNSQRLKEARDAWQKAVELDPTLPNARERLAQVKQELPIESKFERLTQASFDIRYTEQLERPVGFDIRDALLRARREVGSDFQCWPKQKVVVLVYSAEQFRKLRQDTPEWVAGQYDGKIRVPLPDQQMNPDTVTGILFHEYTHALVHQLTENQCPLWFNEGLAEYERWKDRQPPWPRLRQAFAQERLLAWQQLNGQFSTALSAEDVSLAYEQSHSIVRYLVERYGFWRIRQILKAFAKQTPAETVLPAQLHAKWPKLQAEWLAWLRATLAAAGPASPSQLR
ncbi:MAG: tetratricopeptide repeat protein [Candidatus Omnitrophica bacterium]|nr:tetratricopeptide repeat protein [Candidatus Omnitrophota bacterium]